MHPFDALAEDLDVFPLNSDVRRGKHGRDETVLNGVLVAVTSKVGTPARTGMVLMST